jgi:uroporphyrinogen-III synthase
MDELKKVAGKRVVIFRGEDGRELLGRTLTERGARLEYAACYRRVKPSSDITPLIDALVNRELNAIIMTSSEGVRNLLDMAGKTIQAKLLKIPLFVSHERIAKTAGKFGWTNIIPTAPGDDGLVEGLLNYFGSKVAGKHPVSAKS